MTFQWARSHQAAEPEPAEPAEAEASAEATWGGMKFNGLTKKGKSTENHQFSHERWEFPVIFPLDQSVEKYYEHPKISVRTMLFTGLI